MNIFQETWEEYLMTIGHTHENNRMRPNVECRAAFANAVTHFFHNDDISSLWEKDRTTVYHYLRSHETYYRFSKDYREWFNAATQIVSEKVEKVDLNELSEEAKNKIGAHEQIDSIAGTIKVLQNVLSKIEARVRGRKSSQSLQDGGKEVYQMMRDIWGTDLYIAFCEMNSFKYRMRAGKKPGQSMEQDMKKAEWYEAQAKRLRDEGEKGNHLPNHLSHTGSRSHDVRYSSNED